MSNTPVPLDRIPRDLHRKPQPSTPLPTYALRHLRKIIDHLATLIVTIGGLATIFSIFGIFLYLFIEVAPLFYSSTTKEEASVQTQILESGGTIAQTVSVGLDEYMEVGYLFDKGDVLFYDISLGNPIQLPHKNSLSQHQVTSVVRSGSKGHHFALGTQDGKVVPVIIHFQVNFKDGNRSIIPSVNIETPIEILPDEGPVHRFAYQETEEGSVFAAVSTSGRLWLTKIQEATGLFSENGEITFVQRELVTQPTVNVSALLIDTIGESLVVGSTDGYLYYWNIEDAENPRLIGSYPLKDDLDAVTALAYLIGDRSLVVGTNKGNISVWMPYRDPSKGGDPSLRHIRDFLPHSGMVMAISTSQRDKGFLTGDSHGNISVHHSTSSQTVATILGQGSPIHSLMFASKGNGAIALDKTGTLQVFSIENEHPETTVQSLFRPVLYEGYSEPQHIWQSSSGSDEFEPKFGLWPLIFGTFKGTLYAMLFATPLAMFGAIYTAMFMKPNVRAIVKPMVEIMAALPTVVLGFLAGLWFAPLLEKIFPGMVAIFIFLPIVLIVTAMVWHTLPFSFVRQSGGWVELSTMTLVIIGSIWLCLSMNHHIEMLIFGGNYKEWLHSVFGVGYDQRNALVIAFAMGMAVIPTIFSISEDALSNVPRHLIASSLAMGATPWQTLARLVIVSASPGLFSALMIGLGRVVGETMIVLMATGNTPVMDMNLFNGFRTLSANIAVEMPEAPQGGTLYRLLFLSALILFAFTTIVNTVAEIVRQKLRARYSQY